MKRFITEFCPQTASYDEPPDQQPSNLNSHTDLDQPFTIQELNIALNSCNPASSPGLDQINNQMLKNIPQNFRSLILTILNEILATNNLPQEWKEFLVVLIPTKEKKKFRPITLASCVLKLIEKLIQI